MHAHTLCFHSVIGRSAPSLLCAKTIARTRIPQHAPFPGDEAIGVFRFSNPQGARVELLHYGITGYMPREYNPGHASTDRGARREQQQRHNNSRILRNWQHTQATAGAVDRRDARKDVLLMPGHCRPFKVVAALPERPPLLSAVDWDRDTMMVRMQQLMELCQQEGQTYTAQVIGYNAGGLIMSLAGFHQAFMPLSCICRRDGVDGRTLWNGEAIEHHLMGKEVEVAVISVSSEKETVVVSEWAARKLQASRVHVPETPKPGAVE